MDERRCDECFFCVLKDDGYSNYTVENTEVFCIAGAHPVEDGFDHGWGGREQQPHNYYAEQCPSYRKHAPVMLDVDAEEATCSQKQYAAMELAGTFERHGWEGWRELCRTSNT